jgi:hypothetical protein
MILALLLVSPAYAEYWINRAGEHVIGEWYDSWTELQGTWNNEGYFVVSEGTGASKDGSAEGTGSTDSGADTGSDGADIGRVFLGNDDTTNGIDGANTGNGTLTNKTASARTPTETTIGIESSAGTTASIAALFVGVVVGFVML